MTLLQELKQIAAGKKFTKKNMKLKKLHHAYHKIIPPVSMKDKNFSDDKKNITEGSDFEKYKNFFICKMGNKWRVKNDPNDSYAIHHGSFDNVEEAKAFIDGQSK